MIEKGQLLALESGEYSDYGVLGFFRVLRDFDGKEAIGKFLDENPDQRVRYGASAYQFAKWLSKSGYIEDVDYLRWHLGSYGELGGEPEATLRSAAQPLPCQFCGSKDEEFVLCSDIATLPSAAPQAPAPSDTPRTDAEMQRDRGHAAEYVSADFARQLERELATLERAGHAADEIGAGGSGTTSAPAVAAPYIDRGDAVNLARNVIGGGDRPPLDPTRKGIETLALAVLRMDIRNAAPHSVSAPTGELDGAPARGRNTAGGESSSGHAVAAPNEDAERYRWLRECEPERRIEIMERAETPDLLDHHIDKGRAGL